MTKRNVILIMALLALAAIMIIPASAAPVLIPQESYCTVDFGTGHCFAGAFNDGVTNVDAYNVSGYGAYDFLELRFSGGSYNITSVVITTNTGYGSIAYGPASVGLWAWANNQSDPNGYIPPANVLEGLRGSASLPALTGSSWNLNWEPLTNYSRQSPYTPTSAGTRAILMFIGDPYFTPPNTYTRISEIKFYGYRTYANPFNADFNAIPTQGVGPLTVSFHDNSTGGPTAWNWSISPVTGWSAGYNALSSQNPQVYFTANGNYTITLTAANSVDSDTKTKTNYIQVYNSTATVNTCFRAKDANGGGAIQSASIHMKDIENASWTNGTTTLGIASINTLIGHHINAYANASGYSDQDYLNQLATDACFDITMFPAGFANVSAGNVTAYITVRSEDTGQTMPSVSVASQYSQSGNVFGSVVITNGAGIATFSPLPNNTDVHFAATKAGYGGSTIVVNTGTGSGGTSHVSGEIWLSTSKVTPTITGTITGTGTITAVQTYLAYCDPSAADYDQTKCRSSHSNSSLNFLADHMEDLIMLCVFVTMIYLLGFKLGG